MTDIANKTAFVTGAASGIGLALCQSLLSKGANVMMADIDAAGLEEAKKSLKGDTSKIGMVVCDVAELPSVEAAAKETVTQFDKVHLVFNNAGVSLGGRPGSFAAADWRWITNINILGVVNGVETFLPIIAGQGEGGHIVNTASMAGHIAGIGMNPYFATKFAVVGYSEALSQELASVGIGVSCLCPTWVKSNIHNTAAQSPAQGKVFDKAKEGQGYQMIKSLIENGMEAETYAELCMKAVEQNRLYVFNDPAAKEELIKRNAKVMADYDACLADLGMS